MKAFKKLIPALALLAILALQVSAQIPSRSTFAGMRYAFGYGYGGPFGTPPPLYVGGFGLVNAGTNVTLTMAFGQAVLSDGIALMPFAVNAPVTIGIATNQETVTPSAVSCSTPTIYNTCSITETTAFAHGINEPVGSGTFGLQEALNAQPGGMVIVDYLWGQYGTAAMVNAAVTGSSSIVDIRTGQGAFQTNTVTLTNAQVLAMFTTPIQLLAAPGAGNAWDIVDMTIENKNTGVAYAAGGVIQASYGAGVTTPATGTIAATFLTSPTAAQIIKVAGATASTLATTVLNTAVNVTCAAANFTTGTGTVIVKLTYRLLTGL